MFESAETSPGTSVGAAWEAPIDQLGTRLMVEGMSPAILNDLRSIADGAAKNGLTQLAARATALVGAVVAASEKDAESLLKSGITELRSLLDRERSGTPVVEAASYAALGDDAELVADFLVEAREHLSQIEGQMLTLERDPTAMEVIHTVFRAFHTIKGLAGFLDFKVVQAVAHEVETLLDLARNVKLIVDSAIVDVVLESGDFLLSEMASIERVLTTGAATAPADNSALIAKIRTLAVAKDLSAPAAAPAVAKVEPVVVKEVVAPVVAPAAEPVEKPKAAAKKASTPAAADKKSKKVAEKEAAPAAETDAALSMEEEATSPAEVVAQEAPAPIAVATPEPVQPEPVAPVARAIEVVKPEPTRQADPVKMPDASSVRVETAKLDYLMDMVGEMVIAQSLIRHSQVLLSSSDSRLIGDLSQLSRVTAEVQRATMSMRMVPVGQLFQKIERVIRDLSRKAGKQVVLQTSGMDTEVDKTVAEELSDPLLHMVRNSVDHGIEPSVERAANGKNPAAQIKLAAYHQGGQVVIEISDDGRGLDPKKIRAKAEQKGLISSTATLTDTEINQLIFEPGFSTAEKITDVSGRGVGMDVVRRNVEKLRGRIETHSTLGSGTTFLLKLPLTLAIIDGLVIEVGGAQ